MIDEKKNFKYFLSSFTKEELKELSHCWQFEGLSQLNKAELVEALEQKIKNNLNFWLGYLSSRNIQFLKKIIKRQQNNTRVLVNLFDINPPGLYNFAERGILDLVDSEDETSVRIPSDLADLIEKLLNKQEIKHKIKLNDQIIIFVRGLLAYYGALRIAQIYEFFNKYHSQKIDFVRFDRVVEEEFLSTYYIERFDNYYINPGMLEPEDIIEEVEMRSNLDYYFPKKKEIIYAGEHEHEKWNSAQQKFKKSLLNDFDLSQDDASELIFMVNLDIKNDLSTWEILDRIQIEYDFFNSDNIDILIDSLNNLHNNTRMWILKGHTPEEVFKKAQHQSKSTSGKPTSGSVGKQTVVKKEKVGRNDPCPCGSGKKYKKCCLDKENQ
jgi:hypothetical protein